MKLIIVPKNLSPGVFESQIMALLHHSGATGLFFKSEKEKCKLLSGYGVTGKDIIVGWRSLIKLLPQIRMLYTRDVFDFITFFFFKALFFYKISLVHDFRALISEESYLRHRSYFRKTILSSLELLAYTFSKQVYCVSNNLKEELETRFYQKEIVVIPCCISESEILQLQTFPIKKKNSFVYVGSISAWQMFEESVLLYRKLQMKEKSLTVYTKDVEGAQEILDKYSVLADVKSVDRKYIINNLKKFTFGFVLRADSIVNRTASPIKFMEYASNGVIPIATANVGDYSSMFSTNICNLDTLESELCIINKLEELSVQKNIDNMLLKVRSFTWQSYKNSLFGL